MGSLAAQTAFLVDSFVHQVAIWSQELTPQVECPMVEHVWVKLEYEHIVQIFSKFWVTARF